MSDRATERSLVGQNCGAMRGNAGQCGAAGVEIHGEAAQECLIP